MKAHAAETPLASERLPLSAEAPAAASPQSFAPPPPRVEPRLFPDHVARPSDVRVDSRPPEADSSPGRHFPGQPSLDSARYAAAPRPSEPADRTPQFAEARRTLHLSLSGGNGNGNGNGNGHEAPQPSTAGPHAFMQPHRQAPPQEMPSERPLPVRMMPEAVRGKEGSGSAIDHALRERVEADIAAFLTAFDAALQNDTLETRAGLREATDRLLRAGARTRIELERLEARVPLSPRERNTQEVAASRYR